MQITVDTDKVKSLVEDGGKILMSQEAEASLVQLLELQKSVEAAIGDAKKAIEEAALAYNPNFTSVQGEKVKVGYRSFGSKYGIDQATFDKLPPQFYKKKVSYSAETKEVDKYLVEFGSLPLGITKIERPKQISIKLIDDWGDDATSS